MLPPEAHGVEAEEGAVRGAHARLYLRGRDVAVRAVKTLSTAAGGDRGKSRNSIQSLTLLVTSQTSQMAKAQSIAMAGIKYV